MDEPVWLTRMMVDVMHAELIAEHGGAPGVRGGGTELIDSALARPRNKLAYEPEADLADLAAAYIFGLVKNHGYVDGNKRIAFAAGAVFLRLNGWRLIAPEPEAYAAIVSAAAGEATETELALWIRSSCEQ